MMVADIHHGEFESQADLNDGMTPDKPPQDDTW